MGLTAIRMAPDQASSPQIRCEPIEMKHHPDVKSQ
jgi:hypothetical protein